VDPADSGDMKAKSRPGGAAPLSSGFGSCARVRDGAAPQGVDHHQRATEPMCVTAGSSQEHRPAVKPSGGRQAPVMQSRKVYNDVIVP